MTGILLIQLGTPDAPTAAALKPYLKQFLFDPRVVETKPFTKRYLLPGGVKVEAAKPVRMVLVAAHADCDPAVPLVGLGEEVRPHLGREDRLAADVSHDSAGGAVAIAIRRCARAASA